MKIKEVKIHGKTRWRLELGRVNGKRLRPIYSTEAKAQAAIEEREKTEKRYGEIWLQMSANERFELLAVHSECRRAGLSVRYVWDQYRQNGGNTSLVESVPYEVAVEEWKRRKLKAGKDERYVREGAQLLLRFPKKHEKRRPIQEFTADELEAWVDKQSWKSLATRKSNIGRFSSLWSVAKDKRWVTENIVDRLEPVGDIDVDPIIFDNRSCLRLMAVSLLPECNGVIATLSGGLFGGLRPCEAAHKKFGWHRIDTSGGAVTVTGEVAKTGNRRTFTLQPTALAWMRLAKKLKNHLPPKNERRLINRACELAGITHWPSDVLRKTCATHLRNHYENDWHVIHDLGNSIRMLLKHYVDLHIPQKQSREFWRITPKAAKRELVRMIHAGEISYKGKMQSIP